MNFIATFSPYCFTFLMSMIPQKRRKLTKHTLLLRSYTFPDIEVGNHTLINKSFEM